MPTLMGLRLEWSVAVTVRIGAPRLSLPPGEEGGRERERGRERGKAKRSHTIDMSTSSYEHTVEPT